MDLKDKIIGMALAALIALVGWNLHETWSMKEQVFKLQQGQVILSKQIKKNSTFVKQKLKQIKKKQNKKTIDKAIRAARAIPIILSFKSILITIIFT